MVAKQLKEKERKKLEEQGKLRDEFEIWIDKHNHKMEFVRTVTGIVNLLLSSIIILRVFGIL